ncbi:T9SS type A sorting domain-containing protein [Fibrella aquatica]|uniref:T9SS type A sorting domain-containing protein n=1 Tax=Fibrella aquatica TaxID=3242487 RepID=UPI00351FAAA0
MMTPYTRIPPLFIIIVALLSTFVANAQSPSNLTANILWDEDAVTGGPQTTFSGVTAIQNAFTNARRQEETQLGLAANVLGNLILPAGWSGYTNNEKAFVLLNAERTARAGVAYASGTVLGLPFEGSDVNLGTVAQTHADYLKNNDLFTHTGAGGTSPFDRVKAIYPQSPTGVACSQFLSRAENIAIFASTGTSGNPLIIERAVYSWIYDDAPSWGHREACLLQNMDLGTSNPLYGFKNNYGSAASEGFINIATAGATDGSYSYYPTPFLSVDVVVMVIMDPVSSANASANSCAYNLSAPVLPVTLLSFGAALDSQNQVRLQWETASEVNSRFFVVERSRDLINLEAVVTIDASENSQNRQTYVAYDKKPLPGLAYYRLKQVDRTGDFGTFRWQPIAYVPSDFAIVFPNPSTGNQFEVQLSAAEPATVVLADLLGRLIACESQQTATSSLIVRPKVDMSAGSYLMSVSQNGITVVKHVVVR